MERTSKRPATARAPTTSALSARMAGLEQSQWHTPEQLAESQDRKLATLAAHAAQHSDHFAKRLKDAGLSPADLGTAAGFARLPIMGKRDLQDAGPAMFCREIPPGHGPSFSAKSSGSTGEPVVVQRTAASQLDWMATTMRDHAWAGRDYSARLCAVRAQIKTPAVGADWGPPVSLLHPSGPALGLPASMAIDALAHQISRFAPHYLVVYPSILAGLIDHWRDQGLAPTSLREVRLVGETFSGTARGSAAAFLNAKLTDLYSSQEVGNIALQCPMTGLYHVMAETLRVEILDDHGQACKPGETGRVVVTDLGNFATPLVRYDLGDFAEAAAPCRCGRGLPTLARIKGRSRNLVVLPGGERHWPQVGYGDYRAIAPIRQYQLIQEDATTIEVRLVADGSLSAAQEEALAAVIRRKLGYDFALRFAYFSTRLPTGAGGKFEEFLCKM